MGHNRFNELLSHILQQCIKFKNVTISINSKGRERKQYYFTMCSLRRSYVTAGICAGLPHNSLMTLSGHTDVKTVDKYIQQQQQQQQRRAASAMLHHFLRTGDRAMTCRDVEMSDNMRNNNHNMRNNHNHHNNNMSVNLSISHLLSQTSSILSTSRSVANPTTSSQRLPENSQVNAALLPQSSAIDNHIQSISQSQSSHIVNLTQQVQEWQSVKEYLQTLDDTNLYELHCDKTIDWSSQTRNKEYVPSSRIQAKPFTMQLRKS